MHNAKNFLPGNLTLMPLASNALLQRWDMFSKLYAFPPFSLVGRFLQKVEEEAVDVWAVLPMWPSQTWFDHAGDAGGTPSDITQDEQSNLPSSTTRQSSPDLEQAVVNPFFLYQEKVGGKRVIGRRCGIMSRAWQSSTKNQYSPYVKRWIKFCVQREIDFFEVSEYHVVDFLAEFFKSGVGYSAIGSAKAAVLNFMNLWTQN